MDDRQLTLSVVVISWNQLSYLQNLIPQLLNQTLDKSRYEILVVDDGSTDGTREWIVSLHSPLIRLIEGPANRGRSAARNEGILEAHGKIIVMIDGDHEVKNEFLAIHAERHEKERCVIVGKSDFVDHPRYHAINNYLNGSGAHKLPMNARLPGRYFLTRDCSAPRDLLIEVGLFDEAFRSWGGEDLDLGVRLEESRVPLYGELRASALHYHFRSLNALLRNMYVYGRDGVPLLIKKHPKLFIELNLDRTMSNPYAPNRFGGLYRFGMRVLMTWPFYYSMRAIANMLMRFDAPRALFDYLHLRQYTYGYLSRTQSEEHSS
jgi:glycosyltransferase involved in cell wall biosynthesis